MKWYTSACAAVDLFPQQFQSRYQMPAMQQ